MQYCIFFNITVYRSPLYFIFNLIAVIVCLGFMSLVSKYTLIVFRLNLRCPAGVKSILVHEIQLYTIYQKLKPIDVTGVEKLQTWQN